MASGGVITLFTSVLNSGSPQTITVSQAFSVKAMVVAVETDAGTVTAEVQGGVSALSGWTTNATGGNEIAGQSFSTTSNAVLWGETHLQEYRVVLTLTGASSANVTAVALLEN